MRWPIRLGRKEQRTSLALRRSLLLSSGDNPLSAGRTRIGAALLAWGRLGSISLSAFHPKRGILLRCLVVEILFIPCQIFGCVAILQPLDWPFEVSHSHSFVEFPPLTPAPHLAGLFLPVNRGDQR